jgi:hypothetical protein
VTTELLGSTIGAATRVAAGRAIAAGAVSAAVAALVEGTMRSTSMTALKVAATLLTAAGIIATGAGVFAYQTKGNQPAGAIDPRTKAELQPKGIVDPQTKQYTDKIKEALPKPAFADMKKAQGTDPSQTIASLAQARHWSAVVSFEKALSDYQEGRITIDALRAKALRVLEAHRDLINTKDSRIADLENYLGVIRKAWERAKSEPSREELANAEYYRLEAELWLAQAKAGREPSLSGSNPGGRPGTGPSGRPGSDPRSQALLARLEEPIPMSFANPTPLEDVIKYIQQATAGPNSEGIPIYVNPVPPAGINEEEKTSWYEKLMKTPITMNLEGVPLRRTLKLVADQLEMGYGIKDGMVMFTAPDMRLQNWHELLVMEESFPQSSPLDLEVERARRGELTPSELDQLNERLRAIEEVTKRAQSIRMMRFMPAVGAGGMMMRGMPSPPAGPQAKPQ